MSASQDIVAVSASGIDRRKWRDITTRMRPGLPQGYLNKTKLAIESGLYDAAVNYMWDIAICDLRCKVEAYGVDIFLSVLDGAKYNPNGDSLSERWKDIKDYQLIEGCQKINLIRKATFRRLSFWLQIRNHESAAHPVEEDDEVDFDTAMHCVRDIVKYLLSTELPEPGFNIKSLAESIKSRDLSGDIDEILNQLQRLTLDQSSSALKMVVSLFVGGDSRIKSNILLIVNTIWDRSGEEARINIGQRYARHSAEGDIAKKSEVFSILTTVHGVKYIPTNLRAIMFRKASEQLIEAHFSMNNFSGEVSPARQLSELGTDCPDESLDVFATAFTVSYLGNFYGESRASQPYLSIIKDKFSSRHWKAVIKSIRNSSQIQSEMLSSKPFSRLKVLAREMLPHLTTASEKRLCETILQGTYSDVSELLGL